MIRVTITQLVTFILGYHNLLLILATQLKSNGYYLFFLFSHKQVILTYAPYILVYVIYLSLDLD